jgi:hypothetical protein
MDEMLWRDVYLNAKRVPVCLTVGLIFMHHDTVTVFGYVLGGMPS